MDFVLGTGDDDGIDWPVFTRATTSASAPASAGAGAGATCTDGRLVERTARRRREPRVSSGRASRGATSPPSSCALPLALPRPSRCPARPDANARGGTSQLGRVRSKTPPAHVRTKDEQAVRRVHPEPHVQPPLPKGRWPSPSATDQARILPHTRPPSGGHKWPSSAVGLGCGCSGRLVRVLQSGF